MGSKPFLNRRGFFKRLVGRAEAERSFFALQLVWDAAGQNDLRTRIRGVLDDPGVETPDEKRRFYKRLTALLLEAVPYFEYGYFEYITDADDAEATFEQWVKEIEASMATEAEEIADEVDGVLRLSNEQRYIVVSLAFLLEGPHPYDGEDTDEDEIYTRFGLGRLADAINLIDFERVVADAAFLVPGSDDDGFSWSDFADEGWSYLRPVS